MYRNIKYNKFTNSTMKDIFLHFIFKYYYKFIIINAYITIANNLVECLDSKKTIFILY